MNILYLLISNIDLISTCWVLFLIVRYFYLQYLKRQTLNKIQIKAAEILFDLITSRTNNRASFITIGKPHQMIDQIDYEATKICLKIACRFRDNRTEFSPFLCEPIELIFDISKFGFNRLSIDRVAYNYDLRFHGEANRYKTERKFKKELLALVQEYTAN